ncbi:zinc finger CCCH domain-containing protein 15-like [Clavelina lepadiformis]|uniref:zinc finger CCCH domain-containing protein 15-like n=1 Tax=Clavelina lepadiformis TaxID=159417 RepID=UPI0040425F42
MPPKKQQKGSTKADQKKKDKIIEDKTFGLKNKKGTKQQRFVKQVNQQVKYGGDSSTRKLEQQRQDDKKRKEEAKKKQAEIDGLFKPVVVQKVGKGADPKSVLCAFFKQGQCQKGDKCKFSHDVTIERKAEKRSIYSDVRDEDLENDTMDKWDEDKLKQVVEKKHGDVNKQKSKTDIVCKHFLQAIENKKYGWFWSCPNGGTACMYRHALPAGFVLKSEKKKMEEQAEKISIEDLVETERAALGSNVTKVTLETFLAWKKRKREEKIKNLNTKKDKRQKDFKSGKLLGVSGREVFEFQPDLVGEDDAEADDFRYTPPVEGEDEAQVRGISETMFVPEEVDSSGTQATQDRLKATSNHKDESAPQPDGSGEKNATKSVPSKPQDAIDDVPVDENLFTEDLDDLDAELEALDV